MRSPIITQLEKAILPLQGLRPFTGSPVKMGWGALDQAFPHQTFPTGAVHEFMGQSAEQIAASLGFMTALLSRLTSGGGAVAWISRSRNLFPPALHTFGIDPSSMIHIHPAKEKDLLWAAEETLKCKALTAVMIEMPSLGFMASRRLQLCVEQSQVTALIVNRSRKTNTQTASTARWRIAALPSFAEKEMPGVGFPAWQVELLKMRSGRPGSWQVGWCDGNFKLLQKEEKMLRLPYVKTA